MPGFRDDVQLENLSESQVGYNLDHRLRREQVQHDMNEVLFTGLDKGVALVAGTSMLIQVASRARPY